RRGGGGAEQAVALGHEGAVVGGLGLLSVAVGPRADQVRRGQRDLDRVEVERRALLVEQVQKVFHLDSPGAERGEQGAGIRGLGAEKRESLLLAPGPRFPDPQCSSNSMLIASERISLTSTLNDSGMPATISCSPSTMF